MTGKFLPPILLLSVLSLCQCYLLRQGTYLLSYNAQAEPISRILDRETIDPDQQRLLELVQDIKDFAVADLGLKKDRNYTRFVAVDKEYLVDVVSGCAKDAFQPYHWKFPFFGAFPYKGYYRREDALKEAERLKAQDLDVLVRKVDAFSTLGFFADPVYSFMSGYSVFSLASLIIHEQTHATLFVKNEIQFNEEMATFIGWEGALLFLRERYGSETDEYLQAGNYLQDWQRYRTLMQGLYNDLDGLYGRADRERSLRQREQIVSTFNERLANDTRFVSDGFRSIEVPVNNAYIMSFIRYTKDLDDFYRLQEKTKDLFRTIELLKGVKKSKDPPKMFLRGLIADE